MNIEKKDIIACRKSGIDEFGLFLSFLHDAIDEIANEWGENVTSQRFLGDVDDKQVIAIVNQGYKNSYLLDIEGNFYSYNTATEKTGKKTWNGDDVYYDEYATEYTLLEKFDDICLDIVRKIKAGETRTTVSHLESVASQIVATMQD